MLRAAVKRQHWSVNSNRGQILGVCYSVIALISGYPTRLLLLQLTRAVGSYGGGLHIEDVPKEDLIPFSKV